MSLSVAADTSIRSLFSRHADKRLSSLASEYHENTTVDACAVECNAETSFNCKSFSYDNKQRKCSLYAVSLNDRDVRLIDATDVDYYESKFN
jgi:PAN domain